MFTDARKILFRSIGLMLLLVVIIFSYNRYRPYLKGPHITEINIQPYMSIDESFIPVHADIKNTQSVEINGRNILLEEKTNFDELIALSPGNNSIEIILRDTFDKEKIYTYNIYYQSENSDIPITIQQAREEQIQELETLTAVNELI